MQSVHPYDELRAEREIREAVSETRLRVAFLTVMPSPYTTDLFAAMARDARIRPRVCYLEMEAPDTHWGRVGLPDYAEVLPGRWYSLFGARVHTNPGAVKRLMQLDADLYVVTGYSGITQQAVMRWLHRSGKPWIFQGEVPGMNRRGVLGRTLRWLAQRPAVRWPDGIAAIGTSAARAYRQLCGDRCAMASIPYYCDLAPFLAASRGRGYGAGGGLRFLYCGQLIERKGVDLLVSAFCRLADSDSLCTLTLVGTGPLRDQLEQGMPAAVRGRVAFAGFQPVHELPSYFAAADVFVLPSRHDGWGVVVNQAIASGLAVICSDAVGAAADLVQHGENGWIVSAGDAAALHTAMRHSAHTPELSARHGCRSREIAVNWTLERGVDRWVDFCNQVFGRRAS